MNVAHWYVKTTTIDYKNLLLLTEILDTDTFNLLVYLDLSRLQDKSFIIRSRVSMSLLRRKVDDSVVPRRYTIVSPTCVNLAWKDYPIFGETKKRTMIKNEKLIV